MSIRSRSTGADLRLLRIDGPPNFVEIGAGIRLQAVSPILRTGVSSDIPQFDIDKVSGGGNSLTVDLKSSSDLIGFETAWYDLRPKAAGSGFTIVASSAETNIKGNVESQAGPAKNYFQFAPEIGFYRLFYKADQSEVLAAATTRAGLPTDPEACDHPGGPVCLAIPRGVGVNPYMLVNVNGSPVGVAIGSDLQSLIRTMRQRLDKILPTLAITRLWAGKPVAPEFRPLQAGHTQSRINRERADPLVARPPVPEIHMAPERYPTEWRPVASFFGDSAVSPKF